MNKYTVRLDPPNSNTCKLGNDLKALYSSSTHIEVWAETGEQAVLWALAKLPWRLAVYFRATEIVA